MSRGTVIDLGLTDAYNDLFSTQEERDNADRTFVMDIPPSDISDFPNHPFKVRMDDEMKRLVESVKERGILSPVLVRPKIDGGYEMVSGHRRKRASEIAEATTIPCIVRELTDDEATIIMVDANLQRETVLPSERAFAYKMKLEAVKRQGYRADLTSRPMVGKSESADLIGMDTGESGRQVQRYIRLTELVTPLLNLVDEGKIAFRPAVELSYLKPDEQKQLLETMSYDDATPSLAQAIKMKKFSQDGKLSADVILSIMSEEKPNQVEQFKMAKCRIARFFPVGTPTYKMEETIVKALEYYQRFRERQRGQDRER